MWGRAERRKTETERLRHPSARFSHIFAAQSKGSRQTLSAASTVDASQRRDSICSHRRHGGRYQPPPQPTPPPRDVLELAMKVRFIALQSAEYRSGGKSFECQRLFVAGMNLQQQSRRQGAIMQQSTGIRARYRSKCLSVQQFQNNTFL